MRSSTANAAALGAVDISPTTGDGAPSYTSGVHTWNGAADTLNPRPIRIMPSPTTRKQRRRALRKAAAMAAMLVEPVAPKISAMPYRKNAVANDPSRKYFSDDSGLLALRLRKPARMYVEIDEISSPINTSSSSTALDISSMPTAPKTTSAKNSPWFSLVLSKLSSETSSETRMMP